MFSSLPVANRQSLGLPFLGLPGANEAIDANDLPRERAQLIVLTQALNRAAAVLEQGTVESEGVTKSAGDTAGTERCSLSRAIL